MFGKVGFIINGRSYWISIVILTSAIGSLANDEVVCHSNNTFSCDTDDLSHSVLIECNVTSCAHTNFIRTFGNDDYTGDWPSQPGEVIHIYSSRAGSRFTRIKLPDLNFEEDDYTRMLDINTTFYVYTSNRSRSRGNILLGFGTTIDYWWLDRALGDHQFERLFGPLFADLFGGTEESTRFNLLRLLVDTSNVELVDLQATLVRLDEQLGEQNHVRDGKLRILVDLHGATNSRLDVKLGPNTNFTNFDIWAIADETGFFEDQINKITPTLLLQSIRLSEAFDPPTNLENVSQKAGGLLIRSESSIPYNYLQHIIEDAGPDVPIMTAGKMLPKTQSLGDWQNAQESAIELINHIKHGSKGYIEDRSFVDVLHDPSATSDASLYSLHEGHRLHLRGPKFYTMGHISRYVREGSVSLETELFTQPNMFAAHYLAFISCDQKFVVCVVSNENEHLLPFRLAIDRKIRAATNLEAKSMNTFLINISGDQQD